MIYDLSLKNPVSIQYLRFAHKSSCPFIFKRWSSISLTSLKQFTSFQNETLYFFDRLLRRCVDIRQPKQIQTQTILSGSSHSAFLATRLVSLYAKFGLLSEARKVFDTTSVECDSNLLLWNSILRANVSNGEYEESLQLYLQMRNLGVLADGFTFPLVLRACVAINDFNSGKNIHCHVVYAGYQDHLHVVNELLGLYSNFGRMDDAQKLFDRMTVKSHISWNTLISGFSRNYNCLGAAETFRQMELEGWQPNPITWTSLLSSFARCGYCEKTLEFYVLMRGESIEATAEAVAVILSVCADFKAFDRGKVVHAYVIRGGFNRSLPVNNSLIVMYGKNGSVEDADFIFSEMKLKNIVTWNTMISCFSDSGLCDEASELLSQLEKLKDCPAMRANVISWSAVINGYASKGQNEQAIDLFRRMQLAKVTANYVTICTALSVCADLSAMSLGREIHAHVIRNSMKDNVLVGNGLISMYAKCGNLKVGRLVFEKIDDRDLFTWNTMIAGYGMHGFGEYALQTFNRMINSGYHPDEVTFVVILSACGHSGLVEEGRVLFDQMRQDFNIEPQIEHYACLVDLLGRAGLLQEASNIVKHMPIKPNAYIWSALLNACKMHKNKDFVEEIVSQSFSSNSNMKDSFTLLSNIFAAEGRWEESARVRIHARTNGIKKTVGQSWIEVKNKVYMFSAGCAMQEVYRILDQMSLHMK